MKQWEARMQKHRKEAEEEETRKAKGKKAFRKWCEKDKKRAEIEERVWARRVKEAWEMDASPRGAEEGTGEGKG